LRPIADGPEILPSSTRHFCLIGADAGECPSSGFLRVLQATVGNGLSFDPLSLGQDSRAAPAVDVGGGEIVDAFVVSVVVVVVDEGERPQLSIFGPVMCLLVNGVMPLHIAWTMKACTVKSSSMTLRKAATISG